MMNDIEKLADEIHKINEANGWKVLTPNDWPAPGEMESVWRIAGVLALIHSEVSEALEALRHYDKENFAEEMADIMIRLLDSSYGLGIDLTHEVRKKMEQNRQREYRHGGKAI